LKTRIKTSVALIFGIALALEGAIVIAQPTPTSGGTTDKAQPAADFANKERRRQGCEALTALSVHRAGPIHADVSIGGWSVDGWREQVEVHGSCGTRQRRLRDEFIADTPSARPT
jgi:hypothetical protein